MNSITVSIISLSIIFIATTLGSSFVFFFKNKISDKINNLILGFASGIMISASIFGLIIPSINQSKELYPNISFLPPLIGFLLGGLILYILDKFVPHMHKNSGVEEGKNINILFSSYYSQYPRRIIRRIFMWISIK